MIYRSYDTALSAPEGFIEGKLFSFGKVYPSVKGFKEYIPHSCKVKFGENTLCHIAHKKDQLLGRLGANMSLERKADGVYMRLKAVDTSFFKEAYSLVKAGILKGLSPGFLGIPKYRNGRREFDEIDISEVSLSGKPCYDDTYLTAREQQEECFLPPEFYLT